MNAAKILAKRSGEKSGFRERFILKTISFLLPILAKLLHLTIRYQYRNLDHIEEAKKGGGAFAVAIWHQNSFTTALAHQNQPVSILVSPDRWGVLLSSFLKSLGLGSIRGKRVKQRNVTISNISLGSKHNQALAITVDGPLGPLHEVKAGVVAYSQSNKVPILPIAAVPERYWELKTWDRQRIPKPFTKVRVLYGSVIYTHNNSSLSDFEKAKINLSQSLHKLERQAARFRIY